jgi:SNF2 family DNA or RNA helicase/HKD family nuclease
MHPGTMSMETLRPGSEGNEQDIPPEYPTGWECIDNRGDSAANWLRGRLPSCSSASICVAYLSPSGFKAIERELERFLDGGASLSIVSSEEITRTDAEFLLRLAKRYPQIQAKVYPNELTFMHSKVYLLREKDRVHVLVGSSNLTRGGLETNIESNLAGSFAADHPIVRQWHEDFDIIWSRALALESAIDLLREPLPAGKGINMEMLKDSAEHPLPVGTIVVVHGERGKVLTSESIGAGRFRYEILLEASGRAQKWVTPPTEIRPWLGPLDVALSQQFSSPLEYDLRTEALRLSLAYEYDRMVSLSSSRVNLEPYQVEAVHRVVNSFPHRFLIADDTGLGKTIETGMILDELVARGRAERVLVLAPVGVCRNWKRELKECFGRDYILYDGAYLRQLMEKLPPEQNPWDRHTKIIASLDLVKRDEIRAQLERPGCRWDTIIFDEAHKLSSKRYGSKIEETQRYRLGRALADRCDSLLFLTATPHNGDRYAFNALLSLLDEFAFPEPELLDPTHVGQITIRRVKKEIFDEHGNPVFVDRDVKTWPVRYTPQEVELYDAVTEYVVEGFNLAKSQGKEGRAIGFVMVLFQKRMVSSIQAIRLSLRRRLSALKEQLTNLSEATTVTTLSPEEQRNLKDYEEDPDSLDDRERLDLERKLETFVPKLDKKLIQKEIAQLQALTELADIVRADSKKDELLAFLRGIFNKDSTEKVLVFTEYRDTLEYLEREISQSDLFKKNGWKTCRIHGGMDQDEREEAQRTFDQPDTKVMVATDAAGEGINLHWRCHIMVNYELPWNPNRIEQRIGRLHRYGQKREVKAYNLFVTNTREDQILERLLEKLVQIGRDMPGDVYDVLGALLDEVNLTELVMTALMEREAPEVTAERAARAAEERVRMLNRIDKELFQDIRRYDHERAFRLLDKVKETSATSQDIARFAETFLRSHGARILKTKKAGVIQVRDIPPAIRQEGVLTTYEGVTFDRDVARQYRPDQVQLVAFGHPLFDSIVNYCTQAGSGFSGVATAEAVPEGERKIEAGAVFNFRLRCTDGRGATAHEELWSVYVSESGAVDAALPSLLPRLNTGDLKAPAPSKAHQRALLRLQELHSAAWESVVNRSRELENDVQNRRLASVEAMKQDLDRYASSRETKIRMQRAAIEERLRQYKQQPQLLPSGQDIRIIGEEARLRDLDQELEQLRRGVASRGEELGNMEVVVAERPELVSLALIEFLK